MSKDPTFEDLMAIAKEKALKERGEEIKAGAGTSMVHANTILELLEKEEEADNDIIQHVNMATHEQYVICRSEKYACVSGPSIGYHYLFSDDFKEFELQLS